MKSHSPNVLQLLPFFRMFNAQRAQVRAKWSQPTSRDSELTKDDGIFSAGQSSVDSVVFLLRAVLSLMTPAWYKKYISSKVHNLAGLFRVSMI